MENALESDQKHLRWLAIGHLVYAGLIAAVCAFFLLKLLPPLGMIFFPKSFCTGGGRCPTLLYGWFYIGTSVFFCLLGLAFAWANWKVGRSLTRYQQFKLAMWVSAINCLNLPIGTILGGSTIAVLTRDSIRIEFIRRESTPPIQYPQQQQAPQQLQYQEPCQGQQFPPRW